MGPAKSDVNRARRLITVRASETKSGKSRTIPLSDRAWEIIERRQRIRLYILALGPRPA